MPYRRVAMENAIEEVKTGTNSIYDVARKYGINSNTLHDHLSDKHTKIGAGWANSFES